MKKKYENLKKARKIVDIPEPIAINRDFNCVLVSKYVPGKPLFRYFKHRIQINFKKYNILVAAIFICIHVF